MTSLIVTNRGPFEYLEMPDHSYELTPGEGGVATALRTSGSFGPARLLCSPMSHGDYWAAKRGRLTACAAGIEQQFVEIDKRTYDLFYSSFANQVLWLLQHGLPWPPHLTEVAQWEAWKGGYEPANQAFAEAVVGAVEESGAKAVMFQDYHFYLAPLFVRNILPQTYLQHFVHIPWPAPDAWRALPPEIVSSICEGLRANDSVVFQSPEFARNFLLTCREYLQASDVDLDLSLISQDGRLTRVWDNPISIDPDELTSIRSSADFREARDSLLSSRPEKLIVRVDRLDPAKNILRGFEAYELLLDGDPSLRGRVQFLAFLVPSRMTIGIYKEYGESVLRLADEINQKHGTRSWQPIRLVVQHNQVDALAGLAVADVVLVNSIADGMNLVAKEAALINERDATLVLSRTTGAYGELGCGAIGIDPFDTHLTAEALRSGLFMDGNERRARALHLRAAVLRHDLKAWFTSLREDTIDNAAELLEFPDRRVEASRSKGLILS
jgi:trehalose 6-phosphate synthase